MANLCNKMPLVKLSFLICLLFCYFENTLTHDDDRRKRDNEAILYGNQQGSPHLSVKKSGRESIESKMHSEHNLDSDSDSDSEYLEDKDHFENKRSISKRAKRMLVKRSIERNMAPIRMLKRKKRYAEDIDPNTLEKMREILANNYDSYYNDDRNSEELVPDYKEQIPFLVQDQTEEEKDYPRIFRDDDNVEKIRYEIIKVGDRPGIFFPFPRNDEEKQRAIRNKRKEMDENMYRSKLEKLAELLANDN